MQESIEVEEEASLRRALEASRMSIGNADSRSIDATSTTDSIELPDDQNSTVSSDIDEELYVPGRLETALAIAGAGPTPQRLTSTSTPHRPSASSAAISGSSMFGKPTLLLSNRTQTPIKPMDSPSAGPSHSSDLPKQSTSAMVAEPIDLVMTDSDDDLYMEEVQVPAATPIATDGVARPQVSESVRRLHFATPSPPPVVVDDSDGDMEEIVPSPPIEQRSAAVVAASEMAPSTSTPGRIRFASPTEVEAGTGSMDLPLVQEDEEELYEDASLDAPSTPVRTTQPAKIDISGPVGTVSTPPAPASSASKSTPVNKPDDSDEVLTDWSRSPSPVTRQTYHPNTTEDSNGPLPPSSTRTKEDDWDAAQEMDPHAEQGEFARFISQVKGKDLDSVRREIDEEIKGLNQQRKAAMRDSEDVTQHMISQIMVGFLLSSIFSLG